MKERGFLSLALFALLMSILCRSLAFVFAKYAALATADTSVFAILINPWYWAELLALGGQTVFWILVLRHMPLSTAYPALSLVYGINLGWSWLLFGETVTALHVTGILIIMAGIVLTVPAKEREAA